MPSTPALTRTTLVVLLGLGAFAMAPAQSQIRRELGSATTLGVTDIESIRGVDVEAERHYAKSFTYTADPLNPSVNVLDISATADDTVIVIRALIATTEEDSVSNFGVREIVVRAHWDADASFGNGAWLGIQQFTVGSAGTPGTVSASVAGSGPLELIASGANNQRLHTVILEVIANQDLTFAEFTDSM